MSILQQLQIERVHSGACGGPGGWLEHADAAPLASVNPATGEVMASVARATEADCESVLSGAQAAFLHWRTVPAPQRGEIVRQIGLRLREVKDALGTLVAMETGKIKAEGDGEVQEMIDLADLAVGLSRQLYGRTMHSERPAHRLYEQWHPLGVVGVITAFNFPVAVWSWNALIAAVCGDTVVWKPSSKAPLCAIAVQQICNEVMRDNGLSGLFNLLLPEDQGLTERLVDDRRLALISFTGSTRTGHAVARRVSERLGRSLLELSGNNAIIVDQSADLDLATRAIVFGAVGTAGQRCTTTRRVIVQDSVLPQLQQRLLAAYRQIPVGDPLAEGVLMGPLIDAEAVANFEKAVATVCAAGGEILYGGSRLPGPGHFVQPTLVRAENHWAVVQHETFAPILYLITYRHFEQAIRLLNASHLGLSSALFSNDLRHVEQFLSVAGSDCGLANVNIGTSGAEIGGAFGGEKETGGGREAGSDAWRAYMRRQTNTINWGGEMPLAQGLRFELSDL